MGDHAGVSGRTAFGHAMRSDFQFDDGYINLNHGSFGTYPKSVRDVAQSFRAQCEEAPDKLMRYDYVEYLDESRRQIAQLLNAAMDDCVFVSNATLGVNTILRNLRYDEGHCIIYFPNIYGALEKTILSIIETTRYLHARKVEYTLPCSYADILVAFESTIESVRQDGLTPKVCLLETISSVPGVRLPFEDVTRICRENKILSLVDGAHGVGQISLDLTKLDADFFVSNCHKWLYTPRGCAVMHVPMRNQRLIRTTLPTSWGWMPAGPDNNLRTPMGVQGKSDFVNMFAYVGTADSTAYYCVPAALKFRKTRCGDEEAIHQYARDIVQRGADRLAEMFGTEVMDDKSTRDREVTGYGDGGLRDCTLANVRLPIKVLAANGSRDIVAEANTENRAGTAPLLTIEEDEAMVFSKQTTKTIIKEHNIGITIYPYDGKIWARLSGQIYLELQDFEHFANVLLGLLEGISEKL